MTRVAASADALRGGLQRLRAKGWVVLEEASQERWVLTDRGREALLQGLPERRLLRLLERGPRSLDDIRGEGFDPDELTIALGQLKRMGLLIPGRTLALAAAPPVALPEEEALSRLDQGGLPVDLQVRANLQRRGLLMAERVVTRRWAIAPQGSALSLEGAGPEGVGALTAQHLVKDRWSTLAFRPYDVRAPVPFVGGVRYHPYLEWLRQVEEVLVGLGFEEYRGPIVEQEFYNNDLLFMPQEHPARSLHDMLAVAGLEGGRLPNPLLRSVAAAHEGRPLPRQRAPLSQGWQTPYEESVARRVVLRSQTTAATVRYLAGHPRPPFRMYSVDLVFRRDAVDAQHHLQFHQAEGVMGRRGLTFRHLLGLLEQFTHALGIPEVRFQPTYFPFTEPSVQGMVRHPTLGWIEALPGGMFRPEVLRPLGVKVPTAAWGIGIGRLALVALGLNDIRELFLDDLPRLSQWRL
jgi:phenylalanyl-tRNA synthetase alpha chain